MGRRSLTLAAVVLISAGMPGCIVTTVQPTADTTPTGGPVNSARPSATPTSLATSPPAIATALNGAAPYAIVQLPADKVRVLPLRVVFDAFGSDNQRNIYLADLEQGSLAIAAEADGRGWEAWMPDISGNRIAWVEFHYQNPTSFTGDLTWRLMLENFTTNAISELKSGVHARLEGGGAIPPAIRLDGDHVAYGVENPRAGHPLGWRISLLNLNTGELEREFDTDLDLFALDLSGTNIVYSEGRADLVASFKFDLKLMLSTAAHPLPVEIARDAYDVAICGERLAWVSDHEAGRQQSSTPITPVVLTATVSDTTPRQVRITTTAPEAPPSGWGPPRFGAMWPAVGDELISWQDTMTDGKTWAGQLDRLVVWDAATETAYQVDAGPDHDLSSLQGGWLTWETVLGPDGETLTPLTFHGLPLADIPLEGR